MVGAADDAFLFHALHDAGGAVVADLQVALDKRRAGLALAADQSHRLVVESVFLAAAFAATRAGRAVFALGIGGHRLDIDRLGLGLEFGPHALAFLGRTEGAMPAADAAGPGHDPHTAPPEQLLGCRFPPDRPAVSLPR